MSQSFVAPRRLVLVLAVVVLLLVPCGVARAASPAWRLDTLADTTVAPESTLRYLITATNAGDGNAEGSDLVVTATLPPGVTGASFDGSFDEFSCTAGDGVSSMVGASTIRCVHAGLEVPNAQRRFTLDVAVASGVAGTLTSTFTVSGGGAATVSTVDPTRVSSVPPPFGLDAFDGQVTSADGTPFTQAGGHPYAASTSIDFNTLTNPDPAIGPVWPVEPTKDVLVDLPPGLVANPTVAAKCEASDLANGGGAQSLPLCSPDSQVGTVLVRLNGIIGSDVIGPVPVYNMVPGPGVPASFGFNVSGVVVTLDAALRSGTDYGFSVNVRNISEGLDVAGNTFTFWGVPSDPSHDSQRACPGVNAPWQQGPSCASSAPREAFLRNPTSCTAPAGAAVTDGLTTSVHIDSWEHPGRLLADGSADLTDPAWQSGQFVSHLPPGYPAVPGEWGSHQLPTGCASVPFDPSLTGGPTSSRANSASGFSFDLSLQQNNDPSAIGEGDLKSADVTLPEGVRLSPSAATGLEGCSPEQIQLHSTAAPSCPDGSKVGSLTVKTPLLAEPLTGSVYLATPHQNPFGSLVAIYLVANGPGVIVKVAGEVRLDPSTGRIETVFDNNPQTPFSDLHLDFNSGSGAALVTPPSCGTYTTHAVLTSWSGASVDSDSTFTIDRNSDGSSCSTPAGVFAPAFDAGTAVPSAGSFSPFSLHLLRTDREAELGDLSTLTLPPGLLADAASVPVRCTTAQADAASCPAASHVGTVTVGAGPGASPFYVSGDVYLMGQSTSGPFAGNPFGLAVVVHAVAGPFDLGYVVVKGGIQVRDDGSVLTRVEPFPQILQGIPLQLRDIRVSLDRPGFMFNPTSCNPLAFSGSLLPVSGAAAALSERFQVGDCASLKFKPSFTVSTAGKTSKAAGASLHVHLATHEGPTSPSAPGESNIAKVDVQLPVVLPARLPTLQKACTDAQFAKDPAGCPEGSFVGTAVAHTPILASALSGPAILVSHGGLAFPDLVLVLQGEGVRINLTGHTQIKHGITYSHFETVPDAPVTSFDLSLPQGPHGVLTTDVPGRNLCTDTKTVTVTKRVTRRVHGRNRKVTVKARKAVAAPLLMPTTITAQNGMVLRQTTKIAVTGCVKAKGKAKKAKTGKGHGKARARR